VTHAEKLVQALRKGWHTTGDMEALRISQCPWKRLSESGHRFLRNGERLACKVGADGLKRWRVERARS